MIKRSVEVPGFDRSGIDLTGLYLSMAHELRSSAATYIEKLIGDERVSVFQSSCLEFHMVADMLEAAAKEME